MLNDVFFVEDTSRNGTFLNSPKNRLVPGQPHPLKSGDRLLIEPYEIEMSVSADIEATPREPHSPAPQAEFDPWRFDERIAAVRRHESSAPIRAIR